LNHHVSGRAYRIDTFRSLTTTDACRKDSAFAQVGRLDVEIAGSGDVVASELIADRAHLWIAGSGDIEAFVRSEVNARVAGSGDILVLGNPPSRDSQVAGAGKIKFRWTDIPMPLAKGD
jgi:hypothetical protein